jgi:hypothetical protein
MTMLHPSDPFPALTVKLPEAAACSCPMLWLATSA